MTANEIIALSIRAQICGEDFINIPSLSEDELNSVLKLSAAHDIAHIVGAELEAKGLLPEGSAITSAFQKQYMLSVFRAERLTRETERVAKLLEDHKIPFILLKGAILRQYYPEPWMRTSSDTDILVKPNDLDRAKSLIISELNYTHEKTTPHDISLFSEGKVHIELHHSLIEEGRSANCHKILKDVWNETKPVGSEYKFEMTNEMFYFYHIAHMAKHFETGGCGIRPFIDLMVMNNNMIFDEEKKNELLINGKLKKFSDVSCEVCQLLFYTDRSVSDTAKKMADFIINGGVYGDIENQVLIHRNKSQSKLKYYLWRIFPPYKKLKTRYPILEKHPYLTPIYEVKRLFDTSLKKNGVKKIRTELRSAKDVSENDINNIAELFTELGL